jgi:segregation and condensation protein B
MSEDIKMPLPGSLQEIVGALLFASNVPLTVADLRESVRAVECEEGEGADVMDVYKTCTTKEIESSLRGLEKALEVAKVGFKLVCTGGSYRLQTSPSCGRYVRAMLKLDRPSRLGRASLETLAIIAYRQPVTKGEIEDIRGVDVSANIKTLMDLQLIRLVGKSELPGHPFLYGTTPFFLEHFGLASLQQLNELDPTLQRSNPRTKAQSYKRVEKTELEKAAEDAEVEAEKASAEEALKDGEATEENVSEKERLIEQEEVVFSEVSDEDGDDGFFIDDTPDEFDDEDEFDDDEDNDEDEEDFEEEEK